jgi:mono/diheme cytochrome c family protein
MRNYLHVDSTSKLFLIMSIMIILVALSACGNSTSTSSDEVKGAQLLATETPASGAAVEGSLPTGSSTLEVQVAPASALSYSKEVYPIFEASCIKCHGVEKVSRGLDLTSYDKTMTGSVKGPVILPGDADNSLLVKLIVEGKMPKQGAKLTPEQVEIVRNWVSQGAPNN